MKRLKNEAGFSLIGVMVVVMILSVLGLSLVTLSLGSVNISARERDDQSVFYIAEAGITYEMAKIETEIESIYESTNSETDFFDQIETTIIKSEPENSSLNFDELFGEKPIVKFQIEQLNNENPRNYKITSVGIIERDNKEKQRTLSQEFVVEWKEKHGNSDYELPPLAVYTKETISLTNGPIKGSIGTQSKERHAINAGSGVQKVQQGDVYVPVIEFSDENRTCKAEPTAEFKSYSVQRPLNENNMPCPIEITEMWDIPELPSFPPIPEHIMPPEDNVKVGNHYVINNGSLLITHSDANHYEYQMEDDVRFTEIQFNSNRNLTINIGNSDKTIVVDHLDLTNGHLKVVGNGKLTLYVLEKITFGSGSTLNQNGNINNVNIFYKGSEPINFSGNQKIYGSLFAEVADIHLSGSGGIYGNIFTNGDHITLSGGSNIKAQLILAPRAKVSTSGGGSIHGTIMSKSFIHNSGLDVKYGEPFVLDGPISPSALGLSNDPSDIIPDTSSLISKKPIIQD